MRYLIGPELLWLLLYFAAIIVGKMNTPPNKAVDHFIDPCWFYIPAVSVLVFGL